VVSLHKYFEKNKTDHTNIINLTYLTYHPSTKTPTTVYKQIHTIHISTNTHCMAIRFHSPFLRPSSTQSHSISSDLSSFPFGYFHSFSFLYGRLNPNSYWLVYKGLSLPQSNTVHDSFCLKIPNNHM